MAPTGKNCNRTTYLELKQLLINVSTPVAKRNLDEQAESKATSTCFYQCQLLRLEPVLARRVPVYQV